jgi:hypothetical protein
VHGCIWRSSVVVPEWFFSGSRSCFSVGFGSYMNFF